MVRDLQHLASARVVCFHGGKVEHLDTLIKNRKISDLANVKVILVHMGTNNIKQPLSVISQRVHSLMTTIDDSRHGNSKVVFSAVLPRPIDFDRTALKVKAINLEMERLAHEFNFDFSYTFKFFENKKQPKMEMYVDDQVKDKLPLSQVGTAKLKSYIKTRLGIARNALGIKRAEGEPPATLHLYKDENMRFTF